MRKETRVRLTEIGLYIFDCTDIDDAIKTLHDYKDIYSNEYTQISLEVNDNSYDDGKHFVLYGSRLETEEEAQAREAIELKRNEGIEKLQREQYEVLKKKFEGK